MLWGPSPANLAWPDYRLSPLAAVTLRTKLVEYS